MFVYTREHKLCPPHLWYEPKRRKYIFPIFSPTFPFSQIFPHTFRVPKSIPCNLFTFWIRRFSRYFPRVFHVRYRKLTFQTQFALRLNLCFVALIPLRGRKNFNANEFRGINFAANANKVQRKKLGEISFALLRPLGVSGRVCEFEAQSVYELYEEIVTTFLDLFRRGSFRKGENFEKIFKLLLKVEIDYYLFKKMK